MYNNIPPRQRWNEEIPALDGGHIMFNLYELLFRREASEAIMMKFTIARLVVLAGLMGLGLFNDINRLVG